MSSDDRIRSIAPSLHDFFCSNVEHHSDPGASLTVAHQCLLLL